MPPADGEVVAICDDCPTTYDDQYGRTLKQEWMFGRDTDLAEGFAKRHQSLQGHHVHLVTRTTFIIPDAAETLGAALAGLPPANHTPPAEVLALISDIRSLAELTKQNCAHSETGTLADNVLALIDSRGL